MTRIHFDNDKFAVDRLPSVCAPRARLMARMNRAADGRLIAVAAPAGFGKTVLAQLWARQSGCRPIWIALDAYDDRPEAFYRLLATGVLSVQPDNERMAGVLLDGGFSLAPVERTMDLLAGFFGDEGRYALVLDDFHAIAHAEIHRSLPYVLRRLPHSFVVVVLSRDPLPDPLAELACRRGALTLGAQDLAFSAEEIRDYFAALGRPLADGETDRARAFTGGWAIAVNALAQGGERAPDRGGGALALADYIKRQVWDRWPRALRAFVAASAALDEMPVSLLRASAGLEDAEAVLSELHRANAFVSRVRDGVYRYHHLFRDFVRSLPEYEASDRRALLAAAARHYLAQGDYITARRYAYDCGDTRTVLDTIYLFAENRGFSIDGYLDASDALPQPDDALCERLPALYIPLVFASFLRGDARAFERYLDRLRRHIAAIVAIYPKFREALYMLVALDYRVPFPVQIMQAEVLGPMQFETEALRAATMSIQMPFLHRSCRDFCELVDRGLRDRLEATFGKLLKGHYEMVMQCVDAGLLLEQNRLGDALERAEAAHRAAAGAGLAKEMRFAAHMHLVQAYHALGRAKERDELLEATARFVDEGAPFLRPNLLAHRARLRLWDGDRAAARAWLGHYFVADDEPLRPHRLYQYFTTARAHAVLGDFDRARALIAKLQRLGADMRRPMDAAEAGVLAAAVDWASGDRDRAARGLAQVLRAMAPYGFVRVIADEGRAVVPILRKIEARRDLGGPDGDLDGRYLRSVRLAAQSQARRAGGIVPRPAAKPVRLSGQQARILGLLAEGCRNAEIVARTGLTINTVKTHTRIAYEKLGASSAAEAVAKAREKGIL